MSQNRKWIFTVTLLLIFTIGIIGVIIASGLHQKALKQILEFSLNENTKELFGESLRIGHFHLSRDLRIHLGEMHGEFRSEKGSTPLQIQSVESEEAVTNYFSSKGLMLRFRGLRFSDSSNGEGINGNYKIRGGRHWFLNIEAEIHKLGLDEIEWVNPENLKGSKGLISGTISFRLDSKGESELHTKLRISEPGGELQARLFDLLLPYLPQTALKRKVRTMANQLELIHFQTVSMDVDMKQTDQMKILLRILIPDYNLDLNLNITVRLEEGNPFLKLAELMGLIKNA